MTPGQAAQVLRQLSREAHTLSEGVRSLLDAGGLGTATSLQSLRFTQAAFDNAASLFDRLADLVEAD